MFSLVASIHVFICSEYSELFNIFGLNNSVNAELVINISLYYSEYSELINKYSFRFSEFAEYKNNNSLDSSEFEE